MPSRAPLPVDAILADAVASLRRHPALVVQAPPGSGKTTRLPPALLDAIARGELPAGQVIVLEPRRLAARAAARRVAAERGATLGREVGYHVRFDRRASDATGLVFVTEGILRRRLADDPFLDGVAAVVFDEIHERSLDADLSLALARRVQRDARPELLLVAMSATLDGARIAQFLGDAPLLTSEAALHPVTVRWLDAAALSMLGDPGPKGIVERVTWGVREALREGAGGVLAFLPGVGEIRRVRERLEGLLESRSDVTVVELYGDLPPERQDAALAPAPLGTRRIVLATNVAESSVTVDGVDAVVDGGYARELRFDPASGLDRLELVRISRAAADQRAGRAGRQRPGLALRLWTEVDHRTLAAATVPEIARVDLAGACLELLAWGEQPETFPWFEVPSPERLTAARELLTLLGAVDAHGITVAGRTMARFPLHPRLARLLVAGHALGRPQLAALAAALLAERPAALRRRDSSGAASVESDLLALCEEIEPESVSGRADRERRQRGRRGEEREGREQAGDRGVPQVLRARDQLLALLADELGDAPVATASAADALARAVLAAFPDRLAKRREPGSPRAVLCGGVGVRLADASRVRDAELFVALDVDAGRAGSLIHRDGLPSSAEALVRLASGVAREHLPATALTTRVDTLHDAERDRVIGLRHTVYRPLAAAASPTQPTDHHPLACSLELVLDERVVPPGDDEAIRAALLVAATAAPDRAIPRDHPPLTALLARLRFLAAAMPEQGLPVLDDAALLALVPALAAGRRSLAELAAAPWADTVLGLLDHRQRQALDRHAPERLAVPSGSQIRIDYSTDPPVLAVRIQELFGLAETPRLAAGRVPVLLHLLAPNGRPQQVTRDLASFWNTTYAEVRKELAGRYPKHAWPLDPWNAPPQRRPGRPQAS